jgi:micrococcal nuclease
LLVYNLLSDPRSQEVPYDLQELNGPYSVERVVDGDTFIAEVEGERTRIRMLGIDTPESVADHPERITEEGLVASDYTKQLLEGALVFLEYDVEKMDQYERLLAYVYIKDGNNYVMINRLLVEEGYAVPYIIEPNTRYATLLESAEKR